MKDQAIHYLGLDVHQATVVATSRNESGAIVLKATVPTEAKAIVGLVRGQGPRVHVAFEEGTQAQWLHDLLQPVAERVIVCNVRGKKELVNKNDDIDSGLLSERLRLGSLRGVYHGAVLIGHRLLTGDPPAALAVALRTPLAMVNLGQRAQR